MKLTKLTLNHFRNYNHCVFEFNDNLNIIIGNNGTGKTTLLEAIHFLSLTKSFRTHNDTDAISFNNDYFQIFGTFRDNNKKENLVNLNYSKGAEKKLFLNNSELKKKTDIIGKIPVIILSPGIQKITDGGPSIRRNFIDRILSQVDRDYLCSLIEYRKMLSQRNILLVDFKKRNVRKYDKYMETIDDILINHAFYIQTNRQIFFELYNPIFKKSFDTLAYIKKPVDLKINPNISADKEDFKQQFKDKLVDRFERDIILGRTSAGPHLDQISFLFGDRDIRFVGSQGEQKIYLVALKLAESIFIENRTKDKIIFLLDDLFAFLDVKHCMNIIKKIGKRNQTFITATDIMIFKKNKFNFENYNSTIFDLPKGMS